MEQDHLPCSCDQEVFERVWRRVMPEDRPDCPFTLGEDAAAPPAVQPPAAALPAVVHTAPAGEQAPSRPVVGEEHDVPCLGASSAVYGAQLQRLIDRELADWRAYQALSRRAQGNSGRVLATIAADERRHAKRLSTAYFLISGVRYWPVDRVPNPSPAPFSAALREHFMEEQRGAAAYQTAAAETADPCLHELFLELAGEEDSHAWLLRRVLEQLSEPPRRTAVPRGGGLLLVSVDHRVQHPGRHGARRVRTGTAVLHQHHEGVGGVGVAEEAGEPGVGALPPPTSAVPLLAHTSMLGKREAPY